MQAVVRDRNVLRRDRRSISTVDGREGEDTDVLTGCYVGAVEQDEIGLTVHHALPFGHQIERIGE